MLFCLINLQYLQKKGRLLDWRHKRRHWYQGWYQPNMPTTRGFSAFFRIKGASKGARWRNWHQAKHNYPRAQKARFHAGFRSALPSEVEGQRRTKAPVLSPASKSNFRKSQLYSSFSHSSSTFSGTQGTEETEF